jgi:serine/threonine protein kinase
MEHNRVFPSALLSMVILNLLVLLHSCMSAEYPIFNSTNPIYDVQSLRWARNNGFRIPQGQVTLGARLGKGASGYVYEAQLNGEGQYAFKAERPAEVPSLMMNEFNRLVEMQGVYGFPKVFFCQLSSTTRYKYMLMERLGNSLERIRASHSNGLIPLPVAVGYAVQILTRMQALHDRGLIGYDIHPGNFLIGPGPLPGFPEELYWIDLGYAFKYRGPDGKHIPWQLVTVTGKNKYFAIADDMLGQITSRRDDLERMMYMICYLVSGRLPWFGFAGEKNIQIKQNSHSSDICRGLAAPLAPALKLTRLLQFEETPNYRRIEASLRSARERVTISQ